MQTVIYAADAAEVSAERNDMSPDVVHVRLNGGDAEVVLNVAQALKLHQQLEQVLAPEIEAAATEVANQEWPTLAQVAPRLIHELRALGDEYGPLGVIRTAAQMWPDAQELVGEDADARVVPTPHVGQVEPDKAVHPSIRPAPVGVVGQPAYMDALVRSWPRGHA